GDEVVTWNKDVFDMLKSRLDKEYSCFDGTCNPDNPNHWFKKFLNRKDLDIYLQEYQIYDNPYLPSIFVEELEKE
ncbi:MAG: PBSX family phage terminase large subunit, partial [Ruminiclostridium sp.]|nr:PBSX family phage terminase large subunit [Ruminiclostridium sp.]